MDDFDDGIQFCDARCPNCGSSPTYTRDCDSCGGDGCFDGYEEDPLWYAPGETETCDNCRGTGGFHWCRECGYDFTEKRVICAPATPETAVSGQYPCSAVQQNDPSTTKGA